MEYNKKAIAIGIGAIILAVGAYFFFKRKGANDTDSIMPEDIEQIKKDLPIVVADKSGINTLGVGKVFTDFGDGWHYQKRKGGGWIAKKATGNVWYDLTNNESYKSSISKLDSKYSKSIS